MTRRFLIALLLAASCGCSQARVVRILFIGNSYTYVNDLPGTFTKLARAGGVRVETRMEAPGGWRLQDHWEQGSRKALQDANWDYVVLQEQSQLGNVVVVNGQPRVDGNHIFHDAAKNWIEAVLATGAKPVLYLTWARRDIPEDQATLNKHYFQAAAEHHVLVSPAGMAWDRVRRTSSIDLFQTDGSHPSPAGTYLAACALYATIFDKDPETLPSTLPADQTPVLQSAAWAAYQESKR